MLRALSAAVAALLLLAPASASPVDANRGRNAPPKPRSCQGNTPWTRSQWCEYNLQTDYYNNIPNTGRTVEYWFEVQNITASPDGVPRMVQAINGSIPGPTIEANWGDTVIVHVKNSVQNNGTSLHFHGVRQNNTNEMDGVGSITQCPTAPGDTITYKWRAEQYGTSWYHSHFSVQAWDGVLGPIVIHGPASSNYDVDGGTIMLNDWTHKTADELYFIALNGAPVPQTNGLINGLNLFNGTSGSRWSTSVLPNATYLFRIINGAMDVHYQFAIDNHNMTVISTDFVPIKPYQTQQLSIGIGQRYDILITTNQSNIAKDFWMRAIPDSSCSRLSNATDVRAIMHYGRSTGTPTTTGVPFKVNNCTGEPLTSLVPVLAQNVGPARNSSTYSYGQPMPDTISENHFFHWQVNGVAFNASWDYPTAQQIIDGNGGFANSQLAMFAPTVNDYYYIVLTNSFVVQHPIHMHGHDISILAQGVGNYSSSVPLNLVNPPRRDTALMPAKGYLVVGFKTDNPGAWLIHCHIGWHAASGFSLTVVERQSEISALYNKTTLSNTCKKWTAYRSASGVHQENIEDGI